jgi:predicted DNA-binding protein with PD1-like motif
VRFHGRMHRRIPPRATRQKQHVQLVNAGIERSMHFRKIDHSPKTFILVFETGDELAEGLLKFAKEQKISAASFKAIGALSSVRLGWLNWGKKQYEPSVTLDEQVELLSLIGDVALKDGEPAVHAHAVIGKKDGTAHGGHLLQAYIRPTCEVVLTESPANLQKFIDPASGMALIKP